MSKPPAHTIFVSSTYSDLVPYRQAVREAIEALGHTAIVMEAFTASERNPPQLCYDKVRESQLFIGFYAHRYGYVPDADLTYRDRHGDDYHCDGETALTHYEYKWAYEMGLPRLLFVVDGKYEWTAARDDHPRLQAFKDDIGKHYTLTFFTTPESLAEDVTAALTDYFERLNDPILYQPPRPPEDRVHLPEWRPLPPPPGHRVQFPRSAYFTGREKDLHALADVLLYNTTGNGTALSITQATVGMGGVGKSQLAVEFCYRFGRYFKGVHWIQVPATTTLDEQQLNSAIEAEVVACGTAMALPNWPEKFPDQLARTLDVWGNSGPRLVVLDNLEDAAVLRTWLPRLGHARVLLTSRRSKWPAYVSMQVHRLDVMTPDESRLLMRRIAKRLEGVADAELDAIGAALGYLPLAVDLAAHYLDDVADLTPAAYLAQLTEAANVLTDEALTGFLDSSELPTLTLTNMRATFDLTWQRLSARPNAALAQRVFRATGYLAPNAPILQDWLAEAVGEYADERPTTAFVEARTSLVTLGLVNAVDEAQVTVHPLLVAYARIQDAAAEDGLILGRVVQVVHKRGFRATQTDIPSDFEPLRLHTETLAFHAETANMIESATLWNNFGSHLFLIADLKGAQVALERAQAIWEGSLQDNHSAIGLGLNNLGNIYKDKGNLHAARSNYERALSMWESHFGIDNTHVAMVLNNLGCVLRDLGELEMALPILHRALDIYEQAFGSNHADVALVVGNIGTTLQDLGDFVGAETAFGRALEIDEQVLGSNTPRFTSDLNNLGRLYIDLGQWQSAKVVFERALEIDERLFGSHHPKVAIDVNNIGRVLHEQGDLDGARLMFERAIAIDERIYGSSSYYVAIDVNNLGLVLADQGEFAAARVAFERALAVDEQVYGANHFTVAVDINNLGLALQGLGELEACRTAYERALAITEQVLGKDHPNVAKSLNNLALLVHRMGDVDGAISYMERAYDILKQILPEDHKYVVSIQRALRAWGK